MLYKLLLVAIYSFFIIVFTAASFFVRSGSDILEHVFSAEVKNSITSKSIYSVEGTQIIMSKIIDEFQHIRNEVINNTFYYTIKDIRGLNRIPVERILSSLGIRIGERISQSTFDTLLLHLSSHPWIDEFSVSTSIFPQYVHVNVKEAQPWLVADYETTQWLVSTRGVLLDPLPSISDPSLILESGNLPRLYGLKDTGSEVSFLSSANERLRYSLKSLEYVELAGGFPFTYETIFLLPMGNLLVEPLESDMGERVYFTVLSLQDAHAVISKYETVIKDIKSRGEKANEIDLRFKGQVIVR
jgi:hypothetical protein